MPEKRSSGASASSRETNRRTPGEELEARLRLFESLVARYPNTRLETAELTLMTWVNDTAHLPFEELRECVQFAVEHDESGFIPPPGKIIAAFVDRRVEHCKPPGIGNPCTHEELQLTAEHRARQEIRRLKHEHVDRQLVRGGVSELVDRILHTPREKPECD